MNGPSLMSAPRKQRTIRSPVSLTGFGYWSGRDVTVEFRPAAEHSGIVFVRTDLARRSGSGLMFVASDAACTARAEGRR
jgi:UDP-3-O-acyl-N-acetylglucosamine deacetylase